MDQTRSTKYTYRGGGADACREGLLETERLKNGKKINSREVTQE